MELETWPEEELVLDGEAVALNEQGLPDFQLMQAKTGLGPRLGGARKDGGAPVVYYPFDVIYHNGKDLRHLPLLQRKQFLSQVIIPGQFIQPMEYAEEDGESFFDAAMDMGLEGMVAKHRRSVYEAGIRSRLWLKIKGVQAQDFVVGGYTVGTGTRASTFGALLVGYYQDGKFLYAGKVGTGFDQPELGQLLAVLKGLQAEHSPFPTEPEDVGEKVHWVRPELVVKVKFTHWTRDRRLRAPVFQGVRLAIEPQAVRREIAAESLPEAPEERQAPSPAGRKPRSPSPTGGKFEVPSPAGGRLGRGFADSEVADVLEQLSGTQDKLIVKVEGHEINLTNLNKELWPAVTKRDVVHYYTAVSQVLLPHMKGRPLTLTRYPDGIYGGKFYQKHWEHRLPEFVETVRLFSSHREGDGEYIMVNNLPTLAWLSQLADLELHSWLSRTNPEPEATHLTTTFAGSEEAMDSSVLNYPDFIVFDMDPYIYSGKEKGGAEPELNRIAFTKVVEIALALKEILDSLTLASFVKTSGKTGLHVYVPILRQYDYDITRKVCQLIGGFLMRQRPDDITMEWAVSKRPGKISMDYNQNVRGKNMASIYSLRPATGAPVSTPVTWEELEHLYPTDFAIRNIPQRLEELGDLWGDILEAKQDLQRLLETATV